MTGKVTKSLSRYICHGDDNIFECEESINEVMSVEVQMSGWAD